MNIRFLDINEYAKTKDLAIECFGDSIDTKEYYSHDIYSNRIAVIELNNEFVSMAHLKRTLVFFGDKSYLIWYILYVGTRKDYRHKGYMNKLIKFVLTTLKSEGEAFTYLVPVNEKIYKNLGFNVKWEFNKNERDLLYADDYLKHCYACELNNKINSLPTKIEKVTNINEVSFFPFDESAVIDCFEYFYIRHNKSYDSVPLDCFIWNNAVDSEYALVDNRCFFMRDRSGNSFAGCIPFCKEEDLLYYFKLQEKYYNNILHQPFCAYLADNEGVEYLKSIGALDNYEIKEDQEIYDYIYDAESLKTLSGKKLSNKRNKINKFCRDYDGKWNYRTLNINNVSEIIEFLNKWYNAKSVSGKGVNLGDDYTADETLKIEKNGLMRILQNYKILSKIKMGGIYIDNVLCAFSLGCYNPREKMAVIEIEKAFTEFDGLYQLINREFLIHEFPTAEIVNREDDDGIPGLRKSKLSYYPSEFEKRFTIKQKI